jgi:uncharacterized phage-associated protein
MSPAKDIAEYFLASVDEDAGDSLSNLKVQKLCYYAQGFHLALTGNPLFPEEIQAWEHGPVIPSLYREYKQYGAAPIPRPDDFDPDRIEPKVRELLDEVYTVYGQFSATKLRNLTHAETPWTDAYSVGPSTAITHSSLREFFQTLLV